MTAFGIDDATSESYKETWDELRGRGNDLDYERAVFLYNVLVESLHENIDTLKGWMVAILEEYAGKRVSMFIRMVNALDVIDDPDTWTKLGGKSVVLLSRVDGRRRRTILRRVDATLRRTGRDCISEQAFRSIVRAVLGAEAYSELRTESRGQSHPLLTYREQCVIYQQALVGLIQNGIINTRDLSGPVRTLLRMDTRRRGAA